MNAPASALAAHELSRPAQSAFAQSARIGDYDGSFATSLASSYIDKIDGLITELQGMQQVLRSEAERVQREVGNYAQIVQECFSRDKDHYR